MKGRDHGKGAPSAAELLVCFPPRTSLTLLPKPTSSPKKITPITTTKSKITGTGNGKGSSPTLWVKTTTTTTKPIDSEPTSPKVTCAGQIKVRPRPSSSCKNWQSVMEEIEKLHTNKTHKKRLNWVEALGFKKEIMQFLTCLQTLRFDFRCFGSVPTSDLASDDDEEDEDCENSAETHVGIEGIDGNNESSRTVFSKWFMVLQEEQNRGFDESREKSVEEDELPCAPPPNALLLMRSRSAPAKSWLEEREEDEEEEGEEEEEEEKENLDVEEEKRKAKERLLVMGYESDFYKFSSDIAKETWVVGGIRDLLSRSRSSKR